jgi:hypothetical protein
MSGFGSAGFVGAGSGSDGSSDDGLSGGGTSGGGTSGGGASGGERRRERRRKRRRLPAHRRRPANRRRPAHRRVPAVRRAWTFVSLTKTVRLRSRGKNGPQVTCRPRQVRSLGERAGGHRPTGGQDRGVLGDKERGHFPSTRRCLSGSTRTLRATRKK